MSRIGQVLRTLVRPVTPSRGDFGLGTAETIGAMPPVKPQDFVSNQLAASKHKLSPLLGPAPALADLARLMFAPASIAVEQGTRLAKGRPMLPATSAVRGALKGYPEDEPMDAFVRGLMETMAFNAGAPALSRIGKVIQESRPVRMAAEAVQGRLPITVEEAERIVRSGSPPAGFAKRVSQLTLAQRQELARRLGQVQSAAPKPPLALPAPRHRPGGGEGYPIPPRKYGAVWVDEQGNVLRQDFKPAPPPATSAPVSTKTVLPVVPSPQVVPQAQPGRQVAVSQPAVPASKPILALDPTEQRALLQNSRLGTGTFEPGTIYAQTVAGGADRPVLVYRTTPEGQIEGFYLGAPFKAEARAGIPTESLQAARFQPSDLKVISLAPKVQTVQPKPAPPRLPVVPQRPIARAIQAEKAAVPIAPKTPSVPAVHLVGGQQYKLEGNVLRATDSTGWQAGIPSYAYRKGDWYGYGGAPNRPPISRSNPVYADLSKIKAPLEVEVRTPVQAERAAEAVKAEPKSIQPEALAPVQQQIPGTEPGLPPGKIQSSELFQEEDLGPLFKESKASYVTANPAFKAWFGASKVVDESGKPLVVYHGTPSPGFTKFSVKGGLTGELGFWFSSNADATAPFRKERYAGVGPATYPVYLSLKNPMVYDGWKSLVDAVQEKRRGGSIEDGSKSLRRSLMRDGYDGIINKNTDTDSGIMRDDYVAFYPTQIKSATANRGTFDPTNPNILAEQKKKYLPKPGQPAPSSGTLPARPKTPKERQHELTLQAQIKKDYAVSRPAGEVGGPGKARLLALGIRRDLIHQGRVDYRDRIVRSPQDLASLAQVYRDPRFETFRIFYLKGHAIVAHEGITSRMPGMVKPFVDLPKFIYKMHDRMRRLGADGYYILHNHPSGNPNPSPEDRGLTAGIARLVKGFKGHIVIDDKTFAVIETNYQQTRKGMLVEVSHYPLAAKDVRTGLLTPERSHDLLQESVENEADVAEIGKNLAPPKDTVVVLYLSQQWVRAIQELPLHQFNQADQIDRYLLNRQRDFGGQEVVVYYQGAAANLPRANEMIQQKVVADVVIRNRSIRSEMPALAKGLSFQERQAGVYRVSESTPALVRARRQAIRMVLDELRTQAQAMFQSRSTLKTRVVEAGGIKPTLSGGMAEELQAIRPLLRPNGRPIDDLATELGFESGEDLREALVSGQGVKRPSLVELRQQAEQIVDSEAGERILQALQAKGATSKAITAVVKDVTKQTAAAMLKGQQEIRGVLSAAQRKAMTPAQLARYARLQRIEPGATTLGPRGGMREAPLDPADIRRVEAATEQVVPRNITESQRTRLSAGQPTRLPGGPNQPPPVIPTTKGLVPSGFKAQRDVPVSFTRATSEVDIQRAAQFVDGGKLLGPVNQHVVQPVIRADAKAVAKAEAKHQEFKALAKGIRSDSQEDAKLLRAAEDELASGETLAPAEHELVERWVAFRQQALEDINKALVTVGKKPLTGRQDYAPHLPTLTFLGDLFGDLTHVPDEVLQNIPLLRSVFDTPIGQRDPSLPAAVRNLPYIPKHQRAFFLNPRVGGPYRNSLLAGINAYIPLWARITEVAPVVQSSKALLSQMPPNFRTMAEQWLGEQVGRKAQADLLTDAKALRALTRLQQLSSTSLILGRVSTVLLQYSSIANTASKHGWLYAMRGFQKAATPQGRAFAERFSRELQQRMAVGTLLDGDSSAMRIANAALEMADQQMVAGDFLAAFERYTKMSSARFQELTGTEQTFESILDAANIATEQSQASMRRALQSPVLRSKLLRATASQLQSFNVNLRQQQFLDPRLLAMATSNKEAALYVARLDANLLMMNLLYKFFGMRGPTDPADFIPIFDPFTGGVPIGPIGKAVYSGGRFVPAASLLASLVFLISKDSQDDGKLSRASIRNIWKLITMPIPGGGQLVTSIEGLMTVLQGGQRNTRNPQRLDYRLTTPLDALKAMTLGVSTTRAFQDYRQRGFKPVPLTPAQKAINKEKAAFRRQIGGTLRMPRR